MKNYYIAVNEYRTETSIGFANTWNCIKVESRKEQKKRVKEIGVRLATRQEIKHYKKQAELYGVRP